ncbi:MAG: rRNA pseudouridine synthase [Clostridia bacterium]|jgi:23S rRNA pseudouridine2605 synthase|nr:rRNA pseudouridine synthase [Clostridia bacterium]
MRLNKFLAGCGVASRRKCDELISEGKVEVNGVKVDSLGLKIDEKKDKVTVEGKAVKLPSSFVYIKLNKPKGYACSAKDEKGRKTIYDLIDCEERLFSIGRLDYDTEGLIILTNDGDFANKVAHPKYGTEKEYKVTVEGEIKESELAVMRKGVVVEGERMPAARVEWLSYENGFTKLSVIIDEGQNRQIRRMFEAIGHQIKLLKRVRIGGVKLGGLKRGEFRDLTEAELNLLVRSK